MSVLKLENVTMQYPGGENAVRDFSLEVNEGEFIALLGPAGCGKSTLLRVISGLEDVTAGAVWMDAKPMNDVPSKGRDVSMIGQNQGLQTALSIYDNLAYGLRLRKVPEDVIEPEVQAAAEMFGITDLLARKPKQLTAALRQRVLLARAAVRRPRLYLFDEPFSHLDENLHAQMRAELIKLHARLGATFIFATEEPAEAFMVATRVVVMKEGKIEQVGTPQEIYDAPASSFVADYIGINSAANAS
ncbi:MAG: ABC transporter ATP-binding protein [Clostridia bacterium]|nr:ABC transporter ATP-binding protein [Clostridia bacterium]